MAKKVRILSIDGGGIRGILPGVILAYIEGQLQKKTKNPNARLSDYFDLFAGTSTGGILTCVYLFPDGKGRPLFTAKQAVGLYLERGQQIFSRKIGQRLRSVEGMLDEKYNAKMLESTIQQFFGNISLSELIKPGLITAYDIQHRRAHFFTSHDAKKLNTDFYLRDVARATSAAPTYFECAEITNHSGEKFSLVDGGVFANNPALCAYSEARNMSFKSLGFENPRAADMYLVSIGTGDQPEKFEHKRAKKWGKLAWVVPVIDIMMSGSSETVDFHLKMLFDAAGVPKQYVRIEPEIKRANSDMDNATKGNLEALRLDALMNVAKNRDQLDAVVDNIIEYGE